MELLAKTCNKTKQTLSPISNRNWIVSFSVADFSYIYRLRWALTPFKSQNIFGHRLICHIIYCWAQFKVNLDRYIPHHNSKIGRKKYENNGPVYFNGSGNYIYIFFCVCVLNMQKCIPNETNDTWAMNNSNAYFFSPFLQCNVILYTIFRLLHFQFILSMCT